MPYPLQWRWLVAAVAWLAVPLILKPPTGRAQARLAQHDPLWEQHPPAPDTCHQDIGGTSGFDCGTGCPLTAPPRNNGHRGDQPELRETSRFVVIADAGWLPWANRATGVGRYYALNPTDQARETERWSTAATAAG